MRSERVLLALAMLLAALLRAGDLGAFAVTHWDEGLVLRGAVYFASLAAEGHYSPTHGPPLVSVGLAGLVWVFGARPELLVWWNVVLSVASVPLSYAIVARVGTPRAGIVSAFLLALSGLHAMFARSLLTESTYAFFLLATLASSLRALERPRGGWLLATGLAAACTQATKYNGFLSAVPLATLLTWRFVRTPESGGLLQLVRSLAWLAAPGVLVVALNVAAIALVGDLGAFVEHYARYVTAPGSASEILATLAWVAPWVTLAFAVAGWAAYLRAGERASLLHIALLLYVAFLFRYAFYLRLLVPVVTLLVLYAGLGAEALARRLRARPAAALVCLVLFAAAGQFLARSGRYMLREFDGYQRAAEWLAAHPLPEDGTRGRLFATQDFVWEGAAFDAPVFGLPSVGADAILRGCEEIELVVDIGAFSRLRPWDLRGLYPALLEHRVERFEATLNLDALQNNLTLEELRTVGEDAALRERVLGIHVFRLPSATLREWVAGPPDGERSEG